GFSGAEDDYYADLDIPYRAGNRPMLSASELRLVKGMTPELYQALLPHIVALPPGTAININTATVNVLRSMGSDSAGDQFGPVDLAIIESVLERRQEELQLETEYFLATIGSTPAQVPTLENKTNYFLFDGLVKLGDLTVPVKSVLNRDRARPGGTAQSQVSVTRRSLGSL
ncbi:MAG: general secretion pathway protein GspK, partial [Pseudomonadales bacterium]